MKLITRNLSLITEKGFTLVEILVATTIMVIVVAAVYTSFRGGTTAWTQGTAHMERFLNARAALDMMSREISAALIAAYGIYQIDFVGRDFTATVDGRTVDDDCLHFIAPVRGDVNAPDLRRIRFHFDDEEHRELQRGTDDTISAGSIIRPFPEATMPINQHTISLNFRYWDATASPPGWRDDWDSRTSGEGGVILATRNRLPQAVRITIIAEDARRREQQTFSTIVYLSTSR